MRTISTIILLFLLGYIQGQTCSHAISKFTTKDALNHASIGISVIDVSNNKSLFNYNEHLALMPASLTKIITTATALEILGSDYKIPTKIGYSGTINHGVLDGDIIIIGAGDPTTESKYFADRSNIISQWTQAIKEVGINEVKGDIRLQSDNFSVEVASSRWLWEDMGNYYGSGVFPFAVKDNTYKIAFKSGKVGTKVNIIDKSIEAEDLEFGCDVIAAANNKDSAYIYGSPLDNRRIIHGTIPQNREHFEIKGSILFPPQVLGKRIKMKLIQTGIPVAGSVKIEQKVSSDAKSIKTFYSPAINEIIGPTNHKSINMFADYLFWQLPLYYKKEANVRNAFKQLETFWHVNGLETETLKLWDGSGLAPQNTVSPAFLTDMLIWINANSKYKNDFIESLPIAGQTGSVRRMLDGTRLEGTIYMKSGSMDRVRCYSGYVMKNGSPKYAFAIMVNHFTSDSKAVIKAIEQLMLDIF